MPGETLRKERRSAAALKHADVPKPSRVLVRHFHEKPTEDTGVTMALQGAGLVSERNRRGTTAVAMYQK